MSDIKFEYVFQNIQWIPVFSGILSGDVFRVAFL